MNLCIVTLALATLASGCITVPGKAAADESLICIYPQPENTSFCQTATNLTAKEVTSQTSLCTSEQGTVVEECPADPVGCCTTTSGSVDFEKCFYGISAAAGASDCATKAGIWTAGSGTSEAGATE